MTLPAVLGREVSGVVIGVGPRVTEFEVGDEVFGATRDRLRRLRRVDIAQRLLDSTQAAHRVLGRCRSADGCGRETAYDALHDLGLKPGATLLLLGAGGGVGRSTIALALARSINVIGVASESKRNRDRRSGSTLGCVGGRLRRRRVRVVPQSEWTRFSTWSAGDTLTRGAELARPDAPILSIADPLAASRLGGGGVERRRTTAVFTEIAALVADGILDPSVSGRYPFSRAGEALAAVEDGHAAGKVVIEFG